MKAIPLFESHFYHDGRGPELQRVIWKFDGVMLHGFEFYNPDDKHSEDNLRNLSFEKIEAFSMSGEEVHGGILANGETNAAIFEVQGSTWLSLLNQSHLADCKHYQIMFYDEIYDVVARGPVFGVGHLT
jgi:hypothetical protein